MAIVLAAAACEPDGPTQPDPLANPPNVLPVLGHGALTHRFTSELAVRGDWAYTGTWNSRQGNLGNVLYIWNVAGDTPVRSDSIVVPDAFILGDVQISDDGALLVVATEGALASIVVFDLADPARPRQLARHASANTQTGVHTVKLGRVDGRLHAFLSVNPSPPRLVVVDLSDPANPREVLVRQMGNPFIHDVFVRDGILFTALWNDGTTIWDIGGAGRGGSPQNPVQIANVRTVGGKVHNFWWFHDPATGARRYLFVGEEGPSTIGTASSGDVHVVDVADLANPHEVAFFSVPGAGTHNFSMDEARGILYAAYYNGGVRALDVRGDLGDCSAAQRAADGRCDLGRMGRQLAAGLLERAPVYVWGVQAVGDVVYASDMLNGLWKLDASRLRQ